MKSSIATVSLSGTLGEKLEAIAGIPNTLRAFSIPMTSAASDTSTMNGHMTRVRITVSAALAGSKPGASSATSQGANAMPRTVIALREMIARVATLLASRRSRVPSGNSFERVTCGAQLASTPRRARSSVPSVSRTPTARPLDNRISCLKRCKISGLDASSGRITFKATSRSSSRSLAL